MEFEHLKCTESAGVMTIAFTHYEKRNAITNHCLEEILQVLQQVEDSPTINAVVITGNDRCFAAGADLQELASQEAIDTWLNPRPRLWQSLSEFSKPLVAAVNGYAYGAGLELVMICDIVISGQGARFGLPEISLGLIPGAGGTQRLIRAVGKSLANQMVLTGESISAEKAQQSGLVSEITLPELTVERAQQIAETIAKKAPLAVRAAKQAINAAPNTSLDQGLKIERQLFITLAASEDRREGIEAFFNKRNPKYQGR